MPLALTLARALTSTLTLHLSPPRHPTICLQRILNVYSTYTQRILNVYSTYNQRIINVYPTCSTDSTDSKTPEEEKKEADAKAAGGGGGGGAADEELMDVDAQCDEIIAQVRWCRGEAHSLAFVSSAAGSADCVEPAARETNAGAVAQRVPTVSVAGHPLVSLISFISNPNR